MASYLVFVPQAHGHQALDKVGLGSLCADGNPTTIDVVQGPGDQAGVLLTWQDAWNPTACPWLGTDDAKIAWTAVQNGKFWLGQDRASPVQPADLVRHKTYRGTGVVLGDGNTWQVPITAALPRVWGLDERGEFCRPFKPEFKEFCELSSRVFEGLLASVAADPDGEVQAPAGTWDYCCQALGLNYRLCPEVVSWLGLVTDECVGAILNSSVEWDAIQRVIEQKKTAESVTIPAG